MPKLTTDAHSWAQMRKLATATEHVDARTGTENLRAVLAEISPSGSYSDFDAAALYAAAFGALSYMVAHQLREGDGDNHDEYRRGRDAGYAEGHHDGREQAERECEHEHVNG